METPTKKNSASREAPDLRVLLFTGKGGVGKTSTAAATAVRTARAGRGTLILSTDAAHSLSDSFDLPIGSAPTPVAENLWAQEIDVNEQISKNWGPIHQFLNQFMRSQGFDAVIADELAILPGMEEIFSLLQVRDHAADPRFSTIVIDCAPTADTARLLAVPDIARWYMEKIFKFERKIVGAVRPVARRLMDMPLPSDQVFATVEKLYHHLIAVKELLTDRTRTSIRMVVNPEKMVIKEAQRAYTFLSLFDFGIDAVVVNRVLPDAVTDPYYGKWREIQAEHLASIRDSFAPLPILTARLWDREIVGLELLSRLGEEVYAGHDPAEVLHSERPVTVEQENGFWVMRIPMPFAGKEELETWIHGEELTVIYKNFKRNVILPRALSGRELVKAELAGGMLNLRFGGNHDPRC